MKKLLIITLIGGLMIFSQGLVAAAATKTEQAEKNDKTTTEAPKRNYTEKEFREAVLVESEKRLKRLGDNKLVELSRELMKREDDLQLRELELTKQQEQLNINIASFEKSLKEFQEKQSKILSCLDDLDSKKQLRIRHMVDSVSGMKPEMAANILSVQDPEITVEILGQLEPTKVSKIFNLMDKEISARLQKQYMTMKK